MAETAGPVTDAPLHLWTRGGGRYAWLEQAPPALRRDARWEEAGPRLAALGVRRVVLVQAEDSLAETRALEAAAARIEAEAGPVPLDAAAASAALLEGPSALPRPVGVRALVHDDPDPGVLDRPAVRRSLALVAAAGLALDVPDAFPRHLGQATALAHEVPGLRVVLDHLGKPPFGGDTATWERQLRGLAAAPGTVAKISGLHTSGAGPGPGDLERALDLALDLFGPDRLMVGSDWPIAPEPFTADGTLAPLLALVRSRAGAEAYALLRGTAARVYRRRPA